MSKRHEKPLTPEQLAQLPDDQIDTSDIPELKCELSAKFNQFTDLCFNMSSNTLTLLDLRRPPHELARSINNNLSHGMQTL